jgi:AraC-like DNA-binding protein
MSFLNPSKEAEVLDRLKHLMKVEKTYRDESLNLSALAGRIGIPAYALTQILNDRLKQRFSDFVNHYRIEEAKDKLSSGGDDLNILELGLNVGFNSKASFYRAFKKFTDMSPTEYRKVQKT